MTRGTIILAIAIALDVVLIVALGAWRSILPQSTGGSTPSGPRPHGGKPVAIALFVALALLIVLLIARPSWLQN